MTGYPQAVHALPLRPRVAVNLPAALLLPSFGAVVFSVALLQVLFFAEGTQTLFRDSDTGWHVRNGEAILQTFAVPRVDVFSYTRQGQPWFAWEWLSDAALGGAYRLAGLPGVALAAAIAIALTAWGCARLSLSLGGNLFLSAGATVLLLGVTSIHWLARPHVFSWLFALAFLTVAEHERRGRSRWLPGLPILACAWANIHGSFLLGPAILVTYAIGDWAGKRFREPAALKRFGVTAVVCLAATFINPYGWHLHEHVFSYLRNSYLMDHISEFRSFSFHSPGSYYVELFLFAAIAGIIALLRQRAYGPALLGVAMLHMSLYSARHLPTAAVLMLPLTAAAFTREGRQSRGLRQMFDYSDRLQAIDRRVLGIVPVVVVLIATVVGVNRLEQAGSVGFNPEVFPVRAAEFLERNSHGARIFSKDQWGGYLIFRFEGRMKVFLDGRSDFYGQQLLETYGTVVDVKPSWNSVLKEHGVGLVLIPPDHALASALELSPDWKRVYADSVSAIFEKVS
jgi:hypothetical protein